MVSRWKNQTYDDNGNLTNDGERTYVYDAENRLTDAQGQGWKYHRLFHLPGGRHAENDDHRFEDDHLSLR